MKKHEKRCFWPFLGYSKHTFSTCLKAWKKLNSEARWSFLGQKMMKNVKYRVFRPKKLVRFEGQKGGCFYWSPPSRPISPPFSRVFAEVRRLGPSRPPQNSPKIPEKKCFLCRSANWNSTFQGQTGDNNLKTRFSYLLYLWLASTIATL